MVEPRKGVFPACNSRPSSNHTSSCRDSQPGLRSTREEEGVERPTSDTKTPKENRTWGKELQGEFPSLTVNMAEVGTAVGCVVGYLDEGHRVMSSNSSGCFLFGCTHLHTSRIPGYPKV